VHISKRRAPRRPLYIVADDSKQMGCWARRFSYFPFGWRIFMCECARQRVRLLCGISTHSRLLSGLKMLNPPKHQDLYIIFPRWESYSAHNDIKFYSCAALFFSLTCGLGGGSVYISPPSSAPFLCICIICRYGGTNGPCLARPCHGYISIFLFLFFYFIPLLSVHI
jgi:hypothetical protein